MKGYKIMVNRKLSIRKAEHMCNCNSCNAKNYEDETGESRISPMIDICAGNMVIHLCQDCAKKLKEVL